MTHCPPYMWAVCDYDLSEHERRKKKQKKDPKHKEQMALDNVKAKDRLSKQLSSDHLKMSLE